MSISGGPKDNNSGKTGVPFFHEIKKQASFFFKEKIKTARLALTDVTPAELLTEEATSRTLSSPDARTLKIISQAAFEIDDYWRIVEILHKRFIKFDRKYWRISYNSLSVLEHLLTHGPESASEEFQSDEDVIREMQSFQYIDEKGFNWGLSVRKKSERIMKLLEKGPLLKEERDRARKLTRGIEGFGSFSHRSPSTRGISGKFDSIYGRSNSDFNDHGNGEEESPTQTRTKAARDNDGEGDFVATNRVVIGEMNPLLGKRVAKFEEEDHPFRVGEHQSSVSLLSAATDQPLQAC